MTCWRFPRTSLMRGLLRSLSCSMRPPPPQIDRGTATPACLQSKHSTCVQGMFLYSAVSSPLDRSKRFTLPPVTDLFIPTPTRLLREAFSHAAITHNDYSLIFPPLSIAGYSHWGVMERTKVCKLRNGNKEGFEPGFSRLRVRHSTTELPRFTKHLP